MYSLPSPEDESPVRSTYKSRVCSFFSLSLKGTDALRVRDDLRCELIPQGETGGLIIFEDQDAWGSLLGSPVHYYSWAASDVEIHHLEKSATQIREHISCCIWSGTWCGS
jgi:hypothetical protein